MRFSDVLKRALFAALIMGAVMSVHLITVVEPVVDRAIALEEQMSAAEAAPHSHADASAPSGDAEAAAEASHHEDPLFTRSEQKGGGVGAMVLYALAVGMIFATVFAAIRHRLPGERDFLRSLWLAAVGFGVFGLAPALKYPANPPAVGDPATVNQRTIQYVSLLVIGLILAFALTRLSKVLRSRLDDPSRILAVAVATVAAFTLAFVVLPGSPDSIDPAVPAKLIWDFRVRSLGGLALMWFGFAAVFGWLLERRAETADSPAEHALAASGA